MLRRLLDIRQRLEHLRNRCNDLAIFQQRYRPAAAEPGGVLGASDGNGDDDDFVEVVPQQAVLTAADSASDAPAVAEAEEQALAEARRRGKQKVVEDAPEPMKTLADAPAKKQAPAAPPATANATRDVLADDDVLARMLFVSRMRIYRTGSQIDLHPFRRLCSLALALPGLQATAPVVPYGRDLELWTVDEKDLATHRLAMGSSPRKVISSWHQL